MSAGEILLGMGANEFLNEMADKGVQKAVKSYEDALNDPMWLGYMIKTDLAGYLRALSKAKTTFRGINPKDEYCGMRRRGGGGTLSIQHLLQWLRISILRLGLDLANMTIS